MSITLEERANKKIHELGLSSLTSSQLIRFLQNHSDDFFTPRQIVGTPIIEKIIDPSDPDSPEVDLSVVYSYGKVRRLALFEIKGSVWDRTSFEAGAQIAILKDYIQRRNPLERFLYFHLGRELSSEQIIEIAKTTPEFHVAKITRNGHLESRNYLAGLLFNNS